MTPIVKELLIQVKKLDQNGQREFIKQLPKVLGTRVAKRHFTDGEITRMAKIAKMNKGILFNDIASARQFLRNL